MNHNPCISFDIKYLFLMNYLFPQNFTSISLIRKYGFWNQKMRKFPCLFPRIIFIPAAKLGLGFHIREMKP